MKREKCDAMRYMKQSHMSRLSRTQLRRYNDNTRIYTKSYEILANVSKLHALAHSNAHT
jgi:hypothetical protein